MSEPLDLTTRYHDERMASFDYRELPPISPPLSEIVETELARPIMDWFAFILAVMVAVVFACVLSDTTLQEVWEMLS